VHDTGFCSPLVKAPAETEDDVVTKMLTKGRRVAKFEYRIGVKNIQTLRMVLESGATFVEFQIYCEKPKNEDHAFPACAEISLFSYSKSAQNYLTHYLPQFNNFEAIREEVMMPHPATADHLSSKSKNKKLKKALESESRVLKPQFSGSKDCITFFINQPDEWREQNIQAIKNFWPTKLIQESIERWTGTIARFGFEGKLTVWPNMDGEQVLGNNISREVI
jgi:hypothetical protein